MPRRAEPRFANVRRALPGARRLARAIPRLRAEAISGCLLGPTPLHGALHPGNVVLRRRAGRIEPALLDRASHSRILARVCATSRPILLGHPFPR